MNKILGELENEKEKKRNLARVAEQKTKELEDENDALVDKIRNDDVVLRENNDLIKKLKTDNDKADRVIGQLQRQSDMNNQEMDRLKD